MKHLTEELMQKYKDGIWITRDGRELTVSEIDDGHLVNIYRILRNAPVWYTLSPEPFLVDAFFEEHPFLRHAVAELEKRGLIL